MIIPADITVSRDALAKARLAVDMTANKVGEAQGKLRDTKGEIESLERGQRSANIDALSNGLTLPEPSREESKRLSHLQRTLSALPEVLRRAQSDYEIAKQALAHTEAEFGGAVWRFATFDLQPEARDGVERWAGDGHRTLAHLAAIERVREHFATGNLHIANAASDLPWNGRVLITTMIKAIPPKLRGNALKIEDILKDSIAISDVIISEIEGKLK
jgi:hypothetical protein